MIRIRRHRLTALGVVAGRRGNALRTAQERCYDDGGAIRFRGSARIRRAPPHAMALDQQPPFAAAPIMEDDWGWPAAEQSSLAWPYEDGDSVTAMSFGASNDPAVGPVTPTPVVTKLPTPITEPKPLADNELDDDIAELQPTKPMPVSENIEHGVTPELTPVSAPPVAPDNALPPQEDRHAIFGQLGRAMPHATSFQLGRFDVEQHLDMIEHALGQQARSSMVTETTLGTSSELNDLDLLSEITALSEAAGVRPIEAEDDGAFLRKVAKAQTSLAGLDEAARESEEAAKAIIEGDQQEPEEEAIEPSEEDEDQSPFSEDDKIETDETAEDDDG